jgi:hypothetical protein
MPDLETAPLEKDLPAYVITGSAGPAAEKRFTAEGLAAPRGSANPYRLGCAAATWWQRGHDRGRTTRESHTA